MHVKPLGRNSARSILPIWRWFTLISDTCRPQIMPLRQMALNRNGDTLKVALRYSELRNAMPHTIIRVWFTLHVVWYQNVAVHIVTIIERMRSKSILKSIIGWKRINNHFHRLKVVDEPVTVLMTIARATGLPVSSWRVRHGIILNPCPCFPTLAHGESILH